MLKRLVSVLLTVCLIFTSMSMVFAAPTTPTDPQKQVIEEAAKFLEEMGNKAMAENVRKWVKDGKIEVDASMSANGSTNRKGEIDLKGSFVAPLPSDEMEQFKRLASLASLLLHEKTHAHQAPEGGSMSDGVKPGDWTAGYDVYRERKGPDPLEVDAYYKKLLEYLKWAESINKSDDDKKKEKAEWLIAETLRWSAILKRHDYEKTSVTKLPHVDDKLREINNNSKLSIDEKIAQMKAHLEALIKKLFEEGNFYDQARKIYEKKKGERKESVDVYPGDDTRVTIELPPNEETPNSGGQVTVEPLDSDVSLDNSEALEMTVYDFAMPPLPDPGYEIISPVYSVEWNALEPIPFEIMFYIDPMYMETAKIAAFGLNRDEIYKQWTIMDTYVTENQEGQLGLATNAMYATMYALVVPVPSSELVMADHWSYNATERLISLGVLTQEDNLDPDTVVTREQFMMYLVKALGLELMEEPVPYEDVDPSSPYFPYISTAHHYGLTQGVSTYEFGFSDVLSREQSITFLIRARHLEEEALSLSEIEQLQWLDEFSDRVSSLSSWAAPFMAEALKIGLVQGYPDGTLQGTRQLRHSEVVALIERIITLVETNGE